MSRHEIHTEIEINRAPADVWRVLTDFEKHGEWNPLIRSIRGELAEEAKLRLRVVPPGKSGMSFAPRVIRLVPEKELAWRGMLLVDGIFTGEHFFRLEPLSEGRTRLVHGERFSGFLVPFMKGMLAATKLGFEQMNQALKARVEA